MNFRLVPFLSILLATAHGFCAEEDSKYEAPVSQLESDLAQIRGQTALGNYGAKTASASPQIDGCDLFVSIDFLWWKLYEGGTEYAFKDQTRPASITQVKGPIKHLNFDWEPGYKASIGYFFDTEGWDAHLDFTSIESHAHSSSTSSIEGLVPLLGLETLGFQKANVKWHIHFHDLDFLWGRNCFVSKYLALYPYVGLTSAWILQSREAKYSTPLHLSLRGKNDFWGIGPKLGLEGQFYLGRHFSLYGNINSGLLWGRFHVREKEKNHTDHTEEYNLHYNLQRMAPMVGFGLGLSLDTLFNKDHNAFRMRVGYEAQYWWRQNQFPQFNATSLEFTRQSEDLSLQGLTVDFRLGF